MGDLRSEPDRRKQLIDHIAGREGNYPWFYLDGMGLVTIGKGTLVAKEHDARSAAAAVNFTFASSPTKIATPDEVAADWRRVHDKQDLKNIGAIHAGMHSKGFNGLWLNTAQEMSIRNEHAIADRFIFGADEQ